jgi:hypothetical protein
MQILKNIEKRLKKLDNDELISDWLQGIAHYENTECAAEKKLLKLITDCQEKEMIRRDIQLGEIITD